MRHRSRRIALALLAACLLVGTACSTPTRTVTTTETYECAPADATGERDCELVSRETRKEKPDSHGCGGIVSCGFGAVGQVIALPFRILGVVLDVVF